MHKESQIHRMLLHKLGVVLMISVRFFCLESGLIFPSTRALKNIRTLFKIFIVSKQNRF